MIGKSRCSCLVYLATPLVALAFLGFSSCGGGTANMAPLEGEPADDPEIAAIKNSGKKPDEIRKLVREAIQKKKLEAAKRPPSKKGRRP